MFNGISNVTGTRTYCHPICFFSIFLSEIFNFKLLYTHGCRKNENKTASLKLNERLNPFSSSLKRQKILLKNKKWFRVKSGRMDLIELGLGDSIAVQLATYDPTFPSGDKVA